MGWSGSGNRQGVLGVLRMQKGGIRKWQRFQDTQGKCLPWPVNILKEAMLEWYHPESSYRGEEQGWAGQAQGKEAA